MNRYDHRAIEAKWQKRWAESRIHETADKAGRDKCYVLDMFPYPSGEGLHVGHPKGYIATDIYARFKRMNGFNVVHPMGWDAFGLPAENYALKNKIHPRASVDKNIVRYKKQLSIIGLDYDWRREINTTDPVYYRWTQWIFLQMFKKGLAYESNEPINWCPSCMTGLANEDLDGDRCERCGTKVQKKRIRQWVLRITDYADRLLDDLPRLNWPESVKESQRNWIGRSEGLLFTAPVKGTILTIQTFSAHFEAFYADTFVVIAPDHPFLPTLLRGLPNETIETITEFSAALVEKRFREGYEGSKDPEGIFTGRYIVDPVGNGDLPIWVASYALKDYGTGIVKCSAHDERDFAFAKKYGIRLKPVLFPRDPVKRKEVERLEVCFNDMMAGILSEPRAFEGREAGVHRADIIKYAIQNGFAERKVVYRLQDWVFSRQRYWGEPIPLIHCETCGVVPVPESDLPVRLPDVEQYEPSGTGESPLANITEWVNVKCPECGGRGKRETNTMPQWAGSCWYHIAYAVKDVSSSTTSYKLQAKMLSDSWLPVDLYVGGAEHATRHLIYARFWHKFLFDIGVVGSKEPFMKLVNVGLIMGADGRKMSKRFGNVINPDDIVQSYGADTLRVYEMFLGPFEQSGAWSTESVIGARRFLERIERMIERVQESVEAPKELLISYHRTIAKVSADIESLRLNTAISAMMIFVNDAGALERIPRDLFSGFLRLLAPFAPHLSEELHERAGGTGSIHTAEWPVADETYLREDNVVIAVQVDGKLRDSFDAEGGLSEDEARTLSLARDKVAKWTKGKTIRKLVYVPDRLINFITGSSRD